MRNTFLPLVLANLLLSCGGLVAYDASSGNGGNAANGGSTFASTAADSGGFAAASGGGATATGGCANAPVTFEVRPPSNVATNWCIAGAGGCLWWADISNSSGSLTLLDFCTAPCGSCGTPNCSNVSCQVPANLEDGKIEVWDGTYVTYVAASNCGAAQSTCAETTCAPPGQYTCRVCGFHNPSPSTSEGCQRAVLTSEETCVTTVFQYPASAPVVIMMPAE